MKKLQNSQVSVKLVARNEILLPFVCQKQLKCVAEMEGVISVLPNQILELHTTRSWDFMGFPSKGKVESPHEGDVIIGLLDTGYYIKHTIVIILLRKNTKQMLKFVVFLHLLSCRNLARIR